MKRTGLCGIRNGMDILLFISSVMLFAVSMCFTPGPNNALVMAIGMAKGFKAALPFCIGAAFGANISLVFLYFGLKSVFTSFPIVYEVLRYAGAAYMIRLAWRISGLRVPGAYKGATTNGEPPSELISEGKHSQGVKPPSFFQGALFQLVNVKVWLTNIIVISNYVGTGPGMSARFLMTVSLFSIMGFGAMCSWAAGGVVLRRFLTSDGMRRANYVFAAFLVFSVALLFLQGFHFQREPG
ncbi:MAG: LysE family translocator [Desulfovibrionaceae bacterium]|nr:LysE family translocator [Desulfovibrionaceae bacterium]